MKQVLVPAVAVALGLAALPVTAHAGADSGFYFGGGVGQSMVESRDNIDGESFKFDGDDTGYKLIGGFNFGLVPLVDLAAEVSYVDLGKPDDTVLGETLSAELDGFTAFGLAGFKLGPVGLFAKAGVISWDAKYRLGSLSDSDDGTDPAYGLGARFQLGSFAIRGEVEYFDIDDIDDVYFASASLLYTF
ncbi:MAG: outer membrane beta-barrel protein [Gammaproteobacteria bacterium]